jgi:hypothetical protein
MNRTRSLCVLLAVTAVLAGCAASSPTVTPRGTLPARFPEHSASEIRRLVRAGTDTLRSYRAEAQIAIQSPERSRTLSAEMRHRRRDSLFLSLSPGMGIEAARALVTPDSFFVHNRIRSRLSYGSREDTPPSLPNVLASRNLFAPLLGTTAPPADWDVSADSTYYHLQKGRRTYLVDPARWRVVRYEERDAEGRLVEERTFSRFEQVGGLLLPTKLVFRQPQKRRSAVVSYRQRTFNPAQLQFGLEAPASVEHRLIQ